METIAGYLLPVNRDIVRGLDTKPHFVTADVHNRDDDVVPDHDAFVSMSRQHQHERLLFSLKAASSAARGYFLMLKKVMPWLGP
jgi:hypothetical protein